MAKTTREDVKENPAPSAPQPELKEASTPAEEPKVASPKKELAPLVSFARWFQSKGFKPHWRGGMEAFADTTGRRTVEEWDKLFKNY